MTIALHYIVESSSEPGQVLTISSASQFVIISVRKIMS